MKVSWLKNSFVKLAFRRQFRPLFFFKVKVEEFFDFTSILRLDVVGVVKAEKDEIGSINLVLTETTWISRNFKLTWVKTSSIKIAKEVFWLKTPKSYLNSSRVSPLGMNISLTLIRAKSTQIFERSHFYFLKLFSHKIFLKSFFLSSISFTSFRFLWICTLDTWRKRFDLWKQRVTRFSNIW